MIPYIETQFEKWLNWTKFGNNINCNKIQLFEKIAIFESENMSLQLHTPNYFLCLMFFGKMRQKKVSG